jgi:hypothetical protein
MFPASYYHNSMQNDSRCITIEEGSTIKKKSPVKGSKPRYSQEFLPSSLDQLEQPSWLSVMENKIVKTSSLPCEGGYEAASRQNIMDQQSDFMVENSTLLPPEKQSEALKSVICSLLTDNKVNPKDLPLWLQQQLTMYNDGGVSSFIVPNDHSTLTIGQTLTKNGNNTDDRQESKCNSDNSQNEDEIETHSLVVRDKSKEYHICHRCATYKTHYKKDMYSHFNRQYDCPSNLSYTPDEALNYSVSKIYHFTFPTDKLLLNDYIFIIQNYSESYNVINPDYRNESVVDSNTSIQTMVVYKRDKKNGVAKKPRAKRDNSFNQRYYDEKSKRFICDLCDTKYTTKQSLQQHQRSQTKCLMLQKEKMILEVNQQIALKMKNQRTEEQAQRNIYITNNILNNNNSISNTQNNSQSLKVEVRDFVHDRYDVSHINKKYCEDNKDFFIYDKFLDVVMMNDHNHNIFFTDDHKFALVYTNNEFIKMNSDRAGFLVLDKLSNCIGEVICVQKEDIQLQRPKIDKYYNVSKNQYKIDTICKVYDVDTHTFVNKGASNLFRNRDEKLRGIISKVAKHSTNIKRTLQAEGINIAIMKIQNPDIEDYVSIRNRFKELKE